MLKATKHIPMNLQLFADTNPSQADLTAQAMAILQGGGQDQQATTPQGQSMPDGQANPQNSPQIVDNGGQVPGQEVQNPNQVPTEEQPGQQAPSQEEQLILGKFKSPDEVVNAYSSLEQFNTRTRQELAQERQEKEQLQAALQQMQQQMQQSQVQPQVQEPQLTPEEANEQMMNKFYENPSQFFNEIKEQAKQELMQQIAPIQEQYQMQQEQQRWNQAVNDFASQHQDFAQWQPAMADIMNSNPHISGLPNSLEVAYAMAKGQNYQDPNAILQDQNFVKQNILGNQDIKNQIIQEYLQSLNQGKQAPQVISGQVNGAMPMTPENKPTNMQEAKNIALKMMQG